MTILLPTYFIACCCLLFTGTTTAFFFHERILQPHTNKRLRKQISTLLYAKAKNRSVSGFGGAAVQECPCGSGMGYMKCCGKLHRDVQSYVNATAEQVVRARYSAYALREVDFIISSTHPLNKDFMTDIEHWKTQIRNNCYDNFKLTKCRILEEKYDDEIATVKFIANMIQIDLKEKTSFMETSTFERLSEGNVVGAWLYKSGIVESSPE